MLETESLSHELDQKNLIRNISLSFAPGYLYAILGPNGSGKTTLLRHLAGIWKPTQGKVSWKGKELSTLSRLEVSKDIATVSQNHHVPFAFSVEEMILMGRYPHGIGVNTETEKKLQQLLEFLHLKALRHHSITKLSNGERQRVYLARALMTDAEVLLLDEPTTSLDVKHQRELWSTLKNLAVQGKTIIFSTHDFHAAKSFADQIILLDEGSVIASGTYNEAIHTPLFHKIFC